MKGLVTLERLDDSPLPKTLQTDQNTQELLIRQGVEKGIVASQYFKVLDVCQKMGL